MKKSECISKHEHRLMSKNTLNTYLNGLNIFLEYLSFNQIQEVSSKELELFFHFKKRSWDTFTL